MTDEQAKEIAEEWRRQLADASSDAKYAVSPATIGLLLKLYDDIQSIKSSMSGLSFMSAGIKPMTRVDQ